MHYQFHIILSRLYPPMNWMFIFLVCVYANDIYSVSIYHLIGVRGFIKSTISAAHRDSLVTTLSGRVRLLPALTDESGSPTNCSRLSHKPASFAAERKRYFAVSKVCFLHFGRSQIQHWIGYGISYIKNMYLKRFHNMLWDTVCIMFLQSQLDNIIDWSTEYNLTNFIIGIMELILKQWAAICLTLQLVWCN